MGGSGVHGDAPYATTFQQLCTSSDLFAATLAGAATHPTTTLGTMEVRGRVVKVELVQGPSQIATSCVALGTSPKKCEVK